MVKTEDEAARLFERELEYVLALPELEPDAEVKALLAAAFSAGAAAGFSLFMTDAEEYEFCREQLISLEAVKARLFDRPVLRLLAGSDAAS